MELKKILGFALGPIASATLGLFTVPFIAWAFSAEDVGRINMMQVTVSFCMLVFVLGLDQAYVREYHESQDRSRLLKACFTPGFVLLTVTGLGTMTFGSQLSFLLFGTYDPIFYWVTLTSVIVSYVSGFLALILRMQERGLAFSISQVISKCLLFIIIGNIVLFDLSRDFLNLQLSVLVSTMAVAMVLLWNTRAQWRPAIAAELDRQQTRWLLQFGVPLIFSGLAYWGLIATSSIALRTLSTFSELGIYSVTMSFAGVATIFQSIFSVIWAPIVYKWVAEGKDLSRVNDVARQALAVVCWFFTLCGIFSWLTDFLLPIHYEKIKYLVPCAMVQPLLYTLSEVTCVGISITRRTTFAIWIALSALLTNVALSLWLVPNYGAKGAVISNSIAYIVFFVARTEASAYVWRQFPRARIYTFICVAVLLSIATATFALPFHYSLVWLLISPAAIFCFRIELMEMVEVGRIAWFNNHESR